jgi:hypothetical protein
MSMPGFTADASFSNESKGYQAPRTSRTPRTSGKFLPQFSYWYYCDEWGCYTCTNWGCRKIGPIPRPS